MKERLTINFCSVCGYVIVFLLFSVTPQVLHSWDLAVANEKGIDFFSLSQEMQPGLSELKDLNDFYVLTYDYFNDIIYFSARESNASIFAFNLTDRKLVPLMPGLNYDVQGISYDNVTETLFWTDGNGHTIRKLSLHNQSNPIETVFTSEKDIPTGLAISFCKRLLFWTNSNHRSASIDRSNLDGSNHKKLITNNIFLPLAITVDEVNEKLYWTDDERGIYFTIQRCDLDGNHRESILRRTNQEPFGIAVANNAIYWTDTIQKKIWTFSLNALESNYSKYKSEPELFYRFNKSTPYGLVAFREKHFECTSELQVPTSKTQYIIEEFSPKIKNESYCLNLGEKVGNHCRCTKGFTGDRCEISVCHNFCLNGGKCITDSAGYAECLCLPGYLGNRCERDVCSGFCLNGGRCFINNSAPLCSCGMRFLGQRCETSLDFICGQICTNSLENAICNCNSTPSKYEEFMDFTKSQDSSHCRQQRIITIFLLSFEILTMLVVVALARKVCILRRRPRIKKRIIVNKGVKSQTPMTARPQTGPSEQCEITIENCCNMNICETPCFEPNLRSLRPSSMSLQKKTEDEKNLLKNMEEEYEDSDVLYS